MRCLRRDLDACPDSAMARGRYERSVYLQTSTTRVWDLLAAAQVDDDLALCRLLGEKPRDAVLDGVHPQPVATIDERRPTFEFTHEVAIVLGLVGVVELLHRSLRDDAAVVRVHDELVALDFVGIDQGGFPRPGGRGTLEAMDGIVVDVEAILCCRTARRATIVAVRCGYFCRLRGVH